MGYIALAGLIGAGKTTLANKLGRTQNWRVLHEPVEENFLLEKFYKDPKTYAFSMQLLLLHARYKLQNVAAYETQTTIIDRSIIEDRVFCGMHTLPKYGNISADEYKVYEYCFDTMVAIRPPFLMIMLDVSPREALERVKKRARSAEVGISLDYLMDLRDGYEKLIEQIQSGKHPWSRGIQVFRTAWADGSDEDPQEFQRIVDVINKYKNPI